MSRPTPDLQPTLTGPTVLIRPVATADWAEMFAAAADPDIWAVHPVRDRYTEPVFRKFFDSALSSGSAFAIVDRASGLIVGSSRYNGYDPVRREVEIGWTFLARSHWGGATNREVKQLMLTHAFGFVDTVVFWVGNTNWRSQRAMEKIGAIREPGIHYRDSTASPDNLPYVLFKIAREDLARRLG